MGAQCGCDIGGKGSMDGNVQDAAKDLQRFKSLLKANFKNPQDAFKDLDKTGDKSISKEEFTDAIIKAAKDGKWEKDDMSFIETCAGSIFDQLDESNDGSITFKEFKARLKQKIGVEEKDGDGVEKRNSTSSLKKKNSMARQTSDAGGGDADDPSRRKSKNRLSSKRNSTGGSKDGMTDPVERLKGLLKKSYKDPVAAFNSLDQNGDASLDCSEFKAMLLKAGKDCRWDKETLAELETVAQAIFDAMDHNKDGNVTAKEFKSRLKGK